MSASGAVFTQSGDWLGGSDSLFDATGGTVSFIGSETQNLSSSGTTNFFHLNVASGSSLNLDSQTLGVRGDLTVPAGATFDGSNKKILFDGDSMQYLGGGGVIELDNLELDNSSGLLLGQDQLINDTLTLIDGWLDLGAYSLTLGLDANITAMGFDPGRMVVADSSGGWLCRIYPDGASSTGFQVFPIGDNTSTLDYSPATLNLEIGASTSGKVCVQVVDDRHQQV